MDRPDSNIPQAPEGYSRPESSLQNSAGPSNQNGGKPHPFDTPTYKQGFILCVVGGAITGLLSFIGAALVAYGMVIAVYCKKRSRMVRPSHHLSTCYRCGSLFAFGTNRSGNFGYCLCTCSWSWLRFCNREAHRWCWISSCGSNSLGTSGIRCVLCRHGRNKSSRACSERIQSIRLTGLKCFSRD